MPGPAQRGRGGLRATIAIRCKAGGGNPRRVPPSCFPELLPTLQGRAKRPRATRTRGSVLPLGTERSPGPVLSKALTLPQVSSPPPLRADPVRIKDSKGETISKWQNLTMLIKMY